MNSDEIKKAAMAHYDILGEPYCKKFDGNCFACSLYEAALWIVKAKAVLNYIKGNG